MYYNGKKILSVVKVETLTDFTGDISTLSWKDVYTMANNGVDFTSCLGQTKSITVSGTTLNVMLVSTQYNGTKGLVFQTVEALPTQYALQVSSAGSNTGGWGASTFRATLNGTIYNTLSNELKTFIKTVTVPYSLGGKDTTTENGAADNGGTCEDKLFIPSVVELETGTYPNDTCYYSLLEGKLFDYYAKNASAAQRSYQFITRSPNASNQWGYYPANSLTQGVIWYTTATNITFCFVI